MIAPELRLAMYEPRPTPITVGCDKIALPQRARQSTAHVLTDCEGTGYVPNGLVELIKTIRTLALKIDVRRSFRYVNLASGRLGGRSYMWGGRWCSA
jgi:hypothetical protein